MPVGLKLLLDVFGAGAGGSAWTADVLGPFASAGLSGPELWVPSLFCAPRDRLPLPLPLPRSEDIPDCQKIKRQIIGSMCQYWFSSALWKSWHHFKKNWHNGLINMTQLIKPTLSLLMPLQRESKPKRVHNNAGTCHVYADSVTDHL